MKFGNEGAVAQISATERVAAKMEKRRVRKSAPRIDSFLDFLVNHARVKSDGGYVPYHFAGREALRPIVERLDTILASGETDCSLAICGGAQFGKTVLMLNLLAYLVAVRFRNVGYYLPDDDLVQGLVDGKLRPDVLDQIPWLARLLAVGKTLTATGRAANRKGAFLCTDGERTALAFMRGLGKIPTSFSMDVVVQDEKDDLPDEHARFLAGRMTASNLRLSLLIGTQRYHGAGQNLAFTEGTQHIGLLKCSGCFSPEEFRVRPEADPPERGCGERVNPETAWPGVCRVVVEGASSSEWPRLTLEGNFDRIKKINGIGEENRVPEQEAADNTHTFPVTSCASTEVSVEAPGQRVVRATEDDTRVQRAAATIAYSPEQRYALCCPGCGALLDREHPEWHAEAPEREKLRRWSFRLSQLLIPAIELEQIVAAWQLAVRDAEQMSVFCTDRLALPKATTQTLTPGVLEAARGDYILELRAKRVELRRGGATELRGQVRSQMEFGNEGTDPSTSLRSAQDDGAALTWAGNSVRYGGLDLGDQCWFVAREVDVKPPYNVRLLWAEPMAAERVRARVPELFRELDLRAICVDAGPLRDLSRDLVFELNRLVAWSVVAGATSAGCHCTWHEPSQKWRHVRAMAVEFTQREGAGLRHKFAQTQEGRAYPLLAANRDETIERVVQELLPPGVGDPRLVENSDGTAAAAPTQRFFLPAKTESTREVLDLYERHLLVGARQEREGKARRYLDKCENHFLLATAYAALAELIAPMGGEPPGPVVPMFQRVAPRMAQERSLIG